MEERETGRQQRGQAGAGARKTLNAKQSSWVVCQVWEITWALGQLRRRGREKVC